MANYIQDCLQVCASWGLIPTEFRQCMTWEEQVLWLTKFLKEQVIPAVNEVITEENSLYASFQELKQYVDDYFENLDVQEEIDNKLEEMAESGELAEIIAQYVDLGCVYGYNTIAEMAAAENLTAGSIAKVLGKTDADDGDGSFYRIRVRTNADDPDGVNLVVITGSDNLIAQIIPNAEIGDLDDLTTTAKNNVVAAINEIDGDISDINDKMDAFQLRGLSSEELNIYVDATNGDDTATGLDADHPMKTINAAIDKYANRQGKLELKLRLFAPNTYDISGFNWNGISVHFHSYHDGGNITLNFTSQYDFAFYNSHINFQGTSNSHFTINKTNPTTTDVYLDAGNAYMKYTTFNCRFTLWGAENYADHCSFNTLKIRGCSMFMTDCSFGALDTICAKIYANACTVETGRRQRHDFAEFWRTSDTDLTISGSSRINFNNADVASNFANFYGGKFALLAQYGKDSENVFTGNSTFRGTIICATQARWNAFKAAETTTTCQDGYIITSGTTV